MNAQENEYRRKRYAEDPEYRKRWLEACHRYQAAHKAEINARNRLRWATDPEHRARLLARTAKSRRIYVLRQYGISPEEYDRRLALQNGVCAICKKKPKRRQPPVVLLRGNPILPEHVNASGF